MTTESRVAYCFLTIDTPLKPHIWIEWLGDAPVFVHAKNIASLSNFWKTRHITKTYATKWADISLVRATLALFEEAFTQPEIDRVCLLCGTCLPLKPRLVVESFFRNYPLSWLEANQTENQGRAAAMKGGYSWWKGSQWVSITRDDWKTVFHGNDRTDDFIEVFAADESYFPILLADQNRDWFNVSPMEAVWLNPGLANPHTFERIMGIESGKLFIRKISARTQIEPAFLEQLFGF